MLCHRSRNGAKSTEGSCLAVCRIIWLMVERPPFHADIRVGLPAIVFMPFSREMVSIRSFGIGYGALDFAVTGTLWSWEEPPTDSKWFIVGAMMAQSHLSR